MQQIKIYVALSWLMGLSCRLCATLSQDAAHQHQMSLAAWNAIQLLFTGHSAPRPRPLKSFMPETLWVAIVLILPDARVKFSAQFDFAYLQSSLNLQVQAEMLHLHLQWCRGAEENLIVCCLGPPLIKFPNCMKTVNKSLLSAKAQKHWKNSFFFLRSTSYLTCPCDLHHLKQNNANF